MYKVDKINGIVSSYTLGYYLPSKYGVKHSSSEKIHDYLLYNFKDNKINKSNYKWIELAANKCNEKFSNIDIVIRALGSSELKPSTAKNKSGNILGKRIAERLNAHYVPELLSSKRNIKILRKKLAQSGAIKNRPAIIANDKLSFSSGSNGYYNNPQSPRILIIDDITTSGSTAAGIAKAINTTFNNSCEIYFFVLGETCSKPFVSEEKLESSIKRNDRLFNTIETYDPEKIEKEKLKLIEIKNQKEKELKLRKEAEKKRLKEERLKKKEQVSLPLVDTLVVGDFVKHKLFGEGIILLRIGEKVGIEFEGGLRRKLNINYANLKKIESLTRKQQTRDWSYDKADQKKLEELVRKERREKRNELKLKEEAKQREKRDSIRIFQLAKELNISHNDIVDFLKEKGISVTSHMSVIDGKTQKIVYTELVKDKQSSKRDKKKQVKLKKDTVKKRTKRETEIIDLFEPKQKSKKNKSQEKKLQDININFKGLKKKYPHLDIEQEFDRMSDWLLYNDKKYKDHEAFFENWLKEEEKIRLNKEIESRLNNLAEYAEQLRLKKETDELRDLISTYKDEDQAKEYLKKEAEEQRAKEYAEEQRLKKEAEEQRAKEYAELQRLEKELEMIRQEEEKRREKEKLKIQKKLIGRERFLKEQEFKKRQKIAEEKRLKEDKSKKKIHQRNLQLQKEGRKRKIEEKISAQKLKIKKEAARAKKIKHITVVIITTIFLFIIFIISLQEGTVNQKNMEEVTIEETEKEVIIPDFFNEYQKKLEINKGSNSQLEAKHKTPKREQVSTNESPKKSKPNKKEEFNIKIDNFNTTIPIQNKKIDNCSPKESNNNNRNAKDRPATLMRNLSNYHAERVSIFDPTVKTNDGFETWNIYLEESQFLKGKFRYHRKVEKVIVNCFVDNKGKVIQMEILENSSNKTRYEEEAEKLIYVLDFLPGVKNNQDICMWVPISVIFSKRR